MSKRVVSSIVMASALAIVVSVTACSAAPGTATGTAEEELMLELNKRYASGEISKADYDRQRSEISERAQRESVRSGSPMNETIRGFGR